jgi:adenosylcobyric acid synthase
MLGKELQDPNGAESAVPKSEGLGLLNLSTCFEREKKTVQVQALDVQRRQEITGYEIHMGRSSGPDTARPVFQISEKLGNHNERFDGARSEDGLVWGTYIHGVFDAPAFRRDFLNALRKRRGWPPLDYSKSGSFAHPSDWLAQLIRKNVDLIALDRILNEGT